MHFPRPPQEKFGYICPDIAKEFNKYDTQPDKWFKTYDGKNSITKQVYIILTRNPFWLISDRTFLHHTSLCVCVCL